MTGELSAKAEASIGGVLVAAPWWSHYLVEINVIAGTIATICGAVVGLHAVWRIYKHWRRKKEKA